MKIGIDASRNRSGGAKAHIVGLLTGADPRDFGIDKVHVWAYQSLMDAIPDFPWLVKHTPKVLQKNLVRQIWWQYRNLPIEAAENGCDVLFNTDAGSVCPFRPGVTMSQDMLSFEPGEMRRYGFSKARLRLVLLKYMQVSSLKSGHGAIFLTEYARKVIQRTTGPLGNSIVIHHGIGDEFRHSPAWVEWPDGKTVRCLYVSNAAMYKHQWNVVAAVGRVRATGAAISLLLVGGGSGRAQEKLEAEIAATDPARTFIEQQAFAEHGRIPAILREADLFIFASSCENMPITLMEAMASGLPIACSDRGPMPEVLKDGGVYFDPEDPASIESAIRDILRDQGLRKRVMARAKQLSDEYSWGRCSAETWKFLAGNAVRSGAKWPRLEEIPVGRKDGPLDEK